MVCCVTDHLTNSESRGAALAAVTAGRRRLASGGILVGASLGVNTLLSYAFTVIGARLLGPTSFGVLAATMGIVLVINVISLGLQSVGARRIAVRPAARATTVLAVRRSALVLGGATAAILVALTPVFSTALHLGGLATTSLLAVAAVALAGLGAQVGTLQGSQSWRRFAALAVVLGVTRLVIGWAAIAISPTPVSALAGVTVGLLVSAVVGQVFVHTTVPDIAEAAPPSARALRAVIHEVGHALALLFAFFALSSLDVVFARATLSGHDAGLYGAGLIITKAVLFLPYFISVMLFPTLARGGSTVLHRWGLGAVLALGSVVVLGTAAFPGLALAAVGGSAYDEVRGSLWLFAALGCVLAGLQLLVTTALARRHTRVVWIMWAALAGIVVAALVVQSWQSLLTAVLAVDTVLLIVLIALSWRDEVGAAEVPAGA